MIKYEVEVGVDGAKRWFLNDKLHRVDGPAIVHANGTKFWYLKGKRHREDGPAVVHVNGTKYWYLNGKRHREDGPAVVHVNGTKYWYLNGKYLTEAQHKANTNPTVEMTMEEICKALGKNVKVKQND